MKLKIIIGLLVFLTFCNSDLPTQSFEFSGRVDKGVIEYEGLDENSGMVVGINNPDIIWSHNDGSDGKVYGFDKNGKSKVILKLDKSIYDIDSDIEDIAIGKIKGRSYIFLGDFGDNAAGRDNCNIFLFPEPKVDGSEDEIDIPLDDIKTIKFNYSDGARDAECLLFDPISKNLYIVTKQNKNAHLYKINYPFEYSNEKSLELMKQLYYEENEEGLVTGGDISKDGKFILIREYAKVRLFKRDNNKTIENALSVKGQIINSYNYSLSDEPQGEAICWENDNKGFYTASEEKNFPNFDAHLYFFENKTTAVKKKTKR